MRTKISLQTLFIALALVATTFTVSAQDLKSALGGIVKSVVGDKATTESSIIGTWSYIGPECQFESENLMAKAGGEVAAQQVEEKLQNIYEKVGMNDCQYTFNEDGTYSSTFKGKTMKGTYTFDNEAKTITMKGKLGIKMVAYVSVLGDKMSLVFKADKLMAVLKTVTGAAAGVNSTAATINSIADSYDGLRLGFELKK